MAVTLSITVTDAQAQFALDQKRRTMPGITAAAVQAELELVAKSAVRQAVRQFAIDADRQATDAAVASLFSEG